MLSGQKTLWYTSYLQNILIKKTQNNYSEICPKDLLKIKKPRRQSLLVNKIHEIH